MKILVISRYTTDRRSATVCHELNKIPGVELFNLTWSDHPKLHPLRNMFRTGLDTYDYPQFCTNFTLPNMANKEAVEMCLDKFRPDITVLTNEVYEEGALEYIELIHKYNSKVALVAWQNTLNPEKEKDRWEYTQKVCSEADIVLCGATYTVEWHKRFGIGNFVFAPFLAVKDGIFYPIKQEDFVNDESKQIRDDWKGKFIISYIGRFLEWKGIGKIAEAMEVIFLKYPNICFFAVGQGFDDDQEIDKEAQEKLYNLAERYPKRVKIFPFAEDTGSKLREYFNISDLFLYPSIPKYGRIIEQVGVMPADASLCGVPTISTKVGGAPDIILNNKTGYLIDTEKTEELIEAIEKYYELDFNDKLNMRESALAFSQRWLGKNIAKDLYNNFKKVCG